MKTSEAGIQLIKDHEGLRLTSYLCSAKKWTIGWGSTKGVGPGMTITEEQAVERLRVDLQDTEAAVLRLVSVALKQHQFDALVSLIFNIGPSRFAGSTVRKLINARGSAQEIVASWRLWRNASQKQPDGTIKMVQLPGLVRRRLDETNLYSAL
jgi:lysozyme